MLDIEREPGQNNEAVFVPGMEEAERDSTCRSPADSTANTRPWWSGHRRGAIGGRSQKLDGLATTVLT